MLQYNSTIFKVGDRVRFFSERCTSNDGLSNRDIKDNTDYIVEKIHPQVDRIALVGIMNWHDSRLFELKELSFKVGDIVEVSACLSTTSPLSYNTQYVVDDVNYDLNTISVATLIEYWPMDWFELYKNPETKEKMENTLTVSEDFVLKAHEAACVDWKKKIEEQFPIVFKPKNLIKEPFKSFEVTTTVDDNLFGITIAKSWANNNEQFESKSIGFNHYTKLAIVRFSSGDLIIPVKEKILSNKIDGKDIIAYIINGKFQPVV